MYPIGHSLSRRYASATMFIWKSFKDGTHNFMTKYSTSILFIKKKKATPKKEPPRRSMKRLNEHVQKW
jgi:hypothetical protein